MNQPRPKLASSLFDLLPAVALFGLTGILSVWTEGRVEQVLAAEIHETVSFRASKVESMVVSRLQDVDYRMSLYARELDLSILKQSVDNPLPVSDDNPFLWFVTFVEDGLAQDGLRDFGSPAPTQEIQTLMALSDEQDTARKIIDSQSGTFYVSVAPIIDETGNRVGRVYGGMGLDQKGSLAKDLRNQAETRSLFLLHGDRLIGQDPENNATQLQAEMNGRDASLVRNQRAYALHRNLETKDLDLGILLLVDNDRIPQLSAKLRIAALAVIALVLLAYASAIFRLKMSNNRAAEQVLDYAEKTAVADLMVPDYRDTGIRAFDEVGRAIGRSAGEIHARRRQLVEQVSREKERADLSREREEGLSCLLENLPNGVLSTDAQGNITHMNPAAEEITGWPRQEARGLPAEKILHLIHPRTRNIIETPIKAALQSAEAASIKAQTLLVSRDGKEHQVAGCGAALLRNGSQRGAVLVLRDTTEQYFRRNQVNQAKKMEAIGQLAGGIAHDFNNLLSAIMGYAELLQQDLREMGCNQEHISSAELIIDVAKQGAGLTSQLLAFSRQGKMQTEILDIHVVIRSVLKMVKRTFTENIVIEKNLTAEPSLIRGDPAQLENAVLNLALNACEAMGERGKMTVSTSLVTLDESFCRRLKDPVEPGQYLELSFSDTGAGMSREIMEKIFEPFYTTKPIGSGSGLGLAAVYGTVAAHHGAITVYSEPEFGTVFKLHLPLFGDEEHTREKKKRDKPVKGEGLILLIEDEQVVREIAMTMLEQFGYRVLEATNGKEGVDLYERFQSEIGLIILDMEMPVMGGKEALLHLKEINPDVRILIASGYSLDMESKDFFEQGGVRGFIQKPYLMADFSKIISLIMTGEQPPFQ